MSSIGVRTRALPSGLRSLTGGRRLFSWRGAALVLMGLVILYFLIGPLVALVVSATRTTPFGPANWTTDGFKTAFGDSSLLTSIKVTAIYTVAVTAISMIAGVYFATLATRVDCRLRSWITPAMVVMLVTPRLFFALSWQMLGSTNGGLIANGLRGIGADFAVPWFNAMSWQGMIFVSSLKACSAVYLLMLGAVMRVDRSLEDAAVMSGTSRVRAFAGITLPVLTPALFAVGMLSVVESIQAFDIPALLGQPAGIEPYSLHLYGYLFNGLDGDYAAAGALALMLVALVASLLLVQWAVMRGKDYVTVGSAGKDVEPVSVGRAFRWFATGSIVAFIAIGLVVPVLQVVIGSFQGFFGSYSNWTTVNYTDILNDAEAMATLRYTLLIAIGGGFIVAVLSFAMSYAMVRRRGVLGAVSRVGSWVPLTAPGIVLGFALLWMYLKTPGISDLYHTRWLVFAGLSVATIPIAVRALEGVVVQIGPELEQAARMSGAGPLRAIIDTQVRLCLPAILVSWLFVGLLMTGILDVPLLLAGPESNTVATLTFIDVSNGEFAKAAATYCLFLAALMVIVGLLALVAYIFKRVTDAPLTTPITTDARSSDGALA